MKFEDRCGSCENLHNTDDYYDNDPYDEYYQRYSDEEIEDYKRDKGYCSKNGYWYFPTDRKCYYYEQREERSSSLCYITTMVCDRLGMGNDCDTLNTLRLFRNDVLQKDEKYKGILYEYDTVGPKIAEKLRDEDIEVINKIHDTQLKPIVGLIKLHQYDNVINRYVKMTKNLEEAYGISYDEVVPEDYDYTNGGHGKVKILD